MCGDSSSCSCIVVLQTFLANPTAEDKPFIDQLGEEILEQVLENMFSTFNVYWDLILLFYVAELTFTFVFTLAAYIEPRT